MLLSIIKVTNLLPDGGRQGGDEMNVFDSIEGLEEGDPNQLSDFIQTMTDEVIPEIVRVMEMRARVANEIRLGLRNGKTTP